jgi:hypothetical protein
MAAVKRRALAALLLGTVLGSGGCMSFLRPDGPRTLAPGGREFRLAPSAYAGVRQDGNAINLDLMYRVGIVPRADLGVRFNLVSVGMDIKVQLLRAPAPTCGVDIAVAPSVAAGQDISFNSDGPLMVGLPVLVGINLGATRLLLTPQLLYQRVSILPDGVLNVGGTVMFGNSEDRGFHLYPALAVWKALDPRRPVGSLSGPGPWMFQPALVFTWGN